MAPFVLQDGFMAKHVHALSLGHAMPRKHSSPTPHTHWATQLHESMPHTHWAKQLHESMPHTHCAKHLIASRYATCGCDLECRSTEPSRVAVRG